MSEMTKERSLQILKSRTVVNANGKYQVKVTSVHPHEDKHIVNFAAVAIDQAIAAKEAFGKEDYEAAANSNLSTSIFEGNAVPNKGDFVNIQVAERKLRAGGTGFRVIGWSEIAVSTGVASFSWEADAAEALVAEPSELEKAKK